MEKEHRLLISIGQVKQKPFIFKRVKSKVQILKATGTSKLLIVLLFIVKKMIFEKSNVTHPFKRKYFTHFIVNVSLIAKLAVLDLMMIVLFNPERFFISERRILYFGGDLDLYAELLS